MYNDYKEKVIDTQNDEKEIALNDSSDKNDNIHTYFNEIKSQNSKEVVNDSEGDDLNMDDKDAPPKKIFKKLKAKVKGDKENVLKTIKLKLK